MARSTEMDRHLAFQRFGLGARKGVPLTDPRAAIAAELAQPGRALLSAADLAGAGQSGAEVRISSTDMFALHMQDEERIQAERAQKKAAAQMAPPAMGNDMGGAAPPNAMPSPTMSSPAAAPQPVVRPGETFYRREAQARVVHAIGQSVGFVERLVMFWSNHFAVSIQKGLPLRVLAGPFEREAIRAHVLGKFEDMLIAVEQHQAMQIFLDNRGSIGPNSRAGQNRKRGLNENLAREILELHTLGVAGGYSQADVTSLAKVLTGWTVAGKDGRLGAPGSFIFNANAHEPGAHVVVGKTYPDEGVRQGEAALRALAVHPSTARFVATKLARHFVADDPPKSLVGKLEKTFRETGGDLAKVSRALSEAEEAWDAPMTKLRTPYEHLVATFRAFDRAPQLPWEINGPLSAAGQPLWGPMGPNGYADTAETMVAPEAMKTRLEVSAAAARRLGGPVNPSHLADELFGSMLSGETRTAIARAETKAQGHAILLMSPEFMRR